MFVTDVDKGYKGPIDSWKCGGGGIKREKAKVVLKTGLSSEHHTKNLFMKLRASYFLYYKLPLGNAWHVFNPRFYFTSALELGTICKYFNVWCAGDLEIRISKVSFLDTNTHVTSLCAQWTSRQVPFCWHTIYDGPYPLLTLWEFHSVPELEEWTAQCTLSRHPQDLSISMQWYPIG